jgi:UV excision repair protein RAD23
MNVKFKTLSNEQFEIRVDAAATIAEVKARIQTANPAIGLASTMKLIFSGCILEDGSTLETLSLKEGDFLVVMTSKLKPKPATAVPDSLASVALDPSSTLASDGLASCAQGRESERLPADVASHVEADESVDALCAMGFPKADVVRCLRAAFNNAERAVEYLTAGLPAGLADQALAPMPTGEVDGSIAQPTPFPALPVAMGAAEAANARSAEFTAAMDELKNHPQFHGIVDMIRSNPQSLQNVLPAFAEENPRLFAVINSNREEFAEFIAGGEPSWDVGRRLPGREGSGFRFTPEELEAIGRLQQLGFSRAAVVQAFLACDRKEELAANYLFDHGGDLGGD